MARKRKFIDNLCRCRTSDCFGLWPLDAGSHGDRGLAVNHSLAQGNAATRFRAAEQTTNRAAKMSRLVPTRRFPYRGDCKRVRAVRLGNNGPILTNCVILRTTRMTRIANTISTGLLPDGRGEGDGRLRIVSSPTSFSRSRSTSLNSANFRNQRARCTTRQASQVDRRGGAGLCQKPCERWHHASRAQVRAA